MRAHAIRAAASSNSGSLPTAFDAYLNSLNPTYVFPFTFNGTSQPETVNSLSGTLSGGATPGQTGLITTVSGDKSVLFDGSSGQMLSDFSPYGYTPLIGDFTIGAVVNVASGWTSESGIFSIANTNNLNSPATIYLGTYNGQARLGMRVANGGSWQSLLGPSIDDGQPHLVIYKRAGSALSCYMDGSLASSSTVSGSQVVLDSSALILAACFTNTGTATRLYLNGAIDYPFFKLGALSDAQIQALGSKM